VWGRGRGVQGMPIAGNKGLTFIFEDFGKE